MWNLIKIVGAAVLAGAGVGALVKTKVDKAINGEAPKKLPSSKYRIIEVPDNFELQEVDLIGKSKKRPSEEPAEDND